MFARYLRDLTELVDTGGGWCGVFWQRDPDGMRACLDGRELPPWDVLEALLQDLATRHGADAAGRETPRARTLHSAAADAHDRRPGGREVLGERLAVARGEWAYAVEREAELVETVRRSADGAQARELDAELAWVRDDLARARARCTELSARLAALDGAAAGLRPGPRSSNAGGAEHATGRVEGAGRIQPVRRLRTRPEGVAGPGPGSVAPPPAGKADAPAKRRPRGARYAWLDADAEGDGDHAGVALPGTTPPALPAEAAGPRGARYAGVEEPDATPAAPGEDPRAVAGAVAHAVAALLRLRAHGRSGEAHVLLCEAAAWPPARLPALAEALHDAGLGADWATLLWELASLPPGRVAAVAGALEGAGLAEDGRQLLRQGVARPAAEVAAALLALDDAGHAHEVRSLADAFVRVRTPADAALAAQSDPRRLSPLLLDAAQQVSQDRYWDVVHALRVAGAAL